MSRYPKTNSSPDFPALEQEVLDFWQREQVFEASVARNPEMAEDGTSNVFRFFDGPPFANGLPHYGHLLTSCVKDIFPRYQTMKGKKVPRRFGWDCHGLPAEMEAEKELGIQGQLAIEAYGIEKFNAQCRTSVMKYTQDWQDYVNRQARWVDWEDEYKTMDTDYMESVIWAFKELHKKGLIYQGHKVVPYSWACETPLSNFETRMDNAYREKKSKAVTVAFRLKEISIDILAWTTTPWTLPSNLALAVGPDVTYVLIAKDCWDEASNKALPSKEYLVSEVFYETHKDSLFEGFEKAEKVFSNQVTLQFPIKGSELVGLSYEPLFPYFAKTPDAFRVLAGDFIEEGSGTGIVHLAPGFGEDDMRVCAAEGIPVVCPVDAGGKFTAEVPDYEGMQVFESNDLIIRRLKEEGKWIKTEQYLHNYPHCWRTDTPLIYKAVPSWYVKVSAIKERMVELNQGISWMPGHVRDGLFGKWLENAHDWAISRNRFWGAPIPVWMSESGKIEVVGSIAELEALSGEKVADLHRPFIDAVTFEKEGELYRRVPEVLDCWFESGAMPFASVHYPFYGKEAFDKNADEHGALSDFIVEYTAQTRGWFYTLMVLSTALFDKAPFAHCICHGVILDENRQKLSKRLRNYPDPLEVYESFGADAMRWSLVSGPVMQGGELQVKKEGEDIRDVVRLVIKPIWNAYHFFMLYANSDGVEARDVLAAGEALPQAEMDRYILGKLQEAVQRIDQMLGRYDLLEACKAVEGFFEVLNNWYIRRSRERFWRAVEEGAKDQDKQDAYHTLYTCLLRMSKAAAPLLPLLMEQIYMGLTQRSFADATAEASVHLQDFPAPGAALQDEVLIQAMDRVREVCNTALALRNKENIRIRQPLATLTLYGKAATRLSPYTAIIADELNVKEVVLKEELGALAEHKVQIHFPVAGKRLGKQMGQVSAAVKKGEWTRGANGQVEAAGVALLGEEYTLCLQACQEALQDGEVAQATQAQDMLLVLDTRITETLKQEGLARDVVRLVQQARKEADLEITERIALFIEATGALREAVAAYAEYIQEQTLTETLSFDSTSTVRYQMEGATEGGPITIAIAA